MVAYRQQRQARFSTVRVEGAHLPLDLLWRIVHRDQQVEGLTPEDYYLSLEPLNEAISNSWLRVRQLWQAFKEARNRASPTDSGTTLTRTRWLLPLLRELNYGVLSFTPPLEIEGKSYAVSHCWYHVPIHLVSYKDDLDRVPRRAGKQKRHSPYGLVQDLLNRSKSHLWGIVSNGLSLRILRHNVSLTRQEYIEFNLEAMLDGEVYAEFMLLWLLCHPSRLEAQRPDDCWLEKWARTAHQQGVRALDRLRDNVEFAIVELGQGFLKHNANMDLLAKLRTGLLSAQDYYRQVLRLVYRLLVLLVAEDRGILFDPASTSESRERYTRFYSLTRLRDLSEKMIGTRHSDLYYTLRLVMRKLGEEGGCPELGLPVLNGYLFSHTALTDLEECQISNHALLAAVRALSYISSGRTRRLVDYRHLGAEEFGSVYESLLELHPFVDLESKSFKLESGKGNQRKATGSYYTPSSLVECLLDSALDPVLDEACAQPNPRAALLNLKICDPACGSGHFLVAAARRIAARLVEASSDEEAFTPQFYRQALREVIGKCIYGVDINPMAVELCRLNLSLNGIEPGKPFTFLDANIQCGNSLLGVTPALLTKGIPDSAYEPLDGDNKKICISWRNFNRQTRVGQLALSEEFIACSSHELRCKAEEVECLSDATFADAHRKADAYYVSQQSEMYKHNKLLADAWCAAFVCRKHDGYPQITGETLRQISEDPASLKEEVKTEIYRLAQQYQFFHWHIAFPGVFVVPKDRKPEDEQTGWSGGFDVVLGNPPYVFGESQDKKAKTIFQAAYTLAEKQFDMYWLFLEGSLHLTNHKGKAALIIPDALLARDEAQKARRLLLEQGLKNIYHFGAAFQANVSVVGFTVAKDQEDTKIYGKIFEAENLYQSFEYDKRRFLSDSRMRMLISISDEEAQIFSKIGQACSTLQNVIEISRGEEIGKKEVHLHGPIPVIVGEDISRFYIRQPSRFLQRIEKDPGLYTHPKIVVMKTGDRCIAALDENGYVTMQSVYNLRVTVPDLSYEAVLGILNSRLVQCFIYKTFTAYKRLFPQLNQSTIQSIPIPNNIVDHQHCLVGPVKKMQALKSASMHMETMHDIQLMAKSLVEADREINHAVFKLYGLTDKDIELIERNMP